MKSRVRVVAIVLLVGLAVASCSSGGGSAAPDETIQPPDRFCLLWGDWHQLRTQIAIAGNALQAEADLAQLQETVNELPSVAAEDFAGDVAEMQAATTEWVAINQELLAYVNNEPATPPDLAARADAVANRVEALDVLPVASRAFEACGADDAADPTFELPCAYDRDINLPNEVRPFPAAVPNPDEVVQPYVVDTPGAAQAVGRPLPEDAPPEPAAPAAPTPTVDPTAAPAPAEEPRARAVEYALVDENGRAIQLVVLSPVGNDWVETARFSCG